jgi:hypothetical protein
MGHYDNNDAYETDWLGPGEGSSNPWGEGIEVNVADNGDGPNRPVYRVAGANGVTLTYAEFESHWDDDAPVEPGAFVQNYRNAIMSAARDKSTGRQWGREL